MPFDVPGALGAGYTPSQITDYLAANPDQAGGFRVADALKAGYSPDEIVDHLNPNVARPSEQGVPILAPIQRGIAQASAQAANLADDLGYHDTAADIRSRIPQGDLAAKTSGADMAAQIKAGHYGSALADVPSAALEQFVPVAAGVAGGLVTGPTAALAGRLGAGGAIGAVTQGDAIARQRAANNGEATPSDTDLATGLLGGAASGAAGSIGLGGAGAGLSGAIGATLRHAGADALQPEIASLTGSVGTNAGAQLAPASDAAASALTGLGVRGALAAPDVLQAARQVATPAGRADAATAKLAAMTPEQQQRAVELAGAAGDVADTQADAVATGPVSPQLAGKAAAARYASRLSDLTDALDKAGVLPDDGASTIKDATKTAMDPKGVLTQEHLSDIGQLGLDPQTTGLIGTALQRINTLTSPDLTTSSPGPAQAFLQGPAGTVLGGALGGAMGLHGAVVGALAGHAIRPIIAASMGRVGSMVDGILGTSNPSLLAQGQRAAAMLDASGVTIPPTLDGLSTAIQANHNAIETQARMMGLDPAKALSNGLQDTLNQQLARDHSDALALNKQMDQGNQRDWNGMVANAQAMDQQRTQQLNFQRAQQVADATAMDRQLTQSQNFQRAQEVGDATAMDRQQTQQQNFQRSQEVGDATALDRQLTQAQNFQRGQEVSDASAMDQQRTQAQNFQRALDIANARVMMNQDFAARGGPQAQDATLAARAALPAPSTAPAPGTPEANAIARAARVAPSAPNTAPAPGTPEANAIARAALQNRQGPSATQLALRSLSEPMPGVEGLSKAGLLQGQLLPDWQYGIGQNVLQALQLRGMPKNLSPAAVAAAAVQSLQAKGAFSREFGDKLMGHSGRVVRGLYNSIRNEALLQHGVDMRTLAAQQAAPMNAPMAQQAAE